MHILYRACTQMCTLMHTTPVQRTHIHMHAVHNTCQKLSAKNAYGLVHVRLCNGAQSSLRASFSARSCRLSCCIDQTRRPTLFTRNSSKSTLARDTVVAAVLYKHHSIIRVDAGLIQFVRLYCLHLCLATGVTSSRNLFSPFFRATFNLVLENTNTPKIIQNTPKCGLRHDTNVRFSNFRGWCSARFFFRTLPRKIPFDLCQIFARKPDWCMLQHSVTQQTYVCSWHLPSSNLTWSIVAA